MSGLMHLRIIKLQRKREEKKVKKHKIIVYMIKGKR